MIINETWTRSDGVIRQYRNGRLVAEWPEAEAPIAFVRSLEDAVLDPLAGIGDVSGRLAKGDATGLPRQPERDRPVTSDPASSDRQIMRLVVDVMRSPLQRDQWVLTLECGHMFPFTGPVPPGPEIDCVNCRPEHLKRARELHDALRGFTE